MKINVTAAEEGEEEEGRCRVAFTESMQRGLHHCVTSYHLFQQSSPDYLPSRLLSDSIE